MSNMAGRNVSEIVSRLGRGRRMVASWLVLVRKLWAAEVPA
jgi:hypothetical protein